MVSLTCGRGVTSWSAARLHDRVRGSSPLVSIVLGSTNAPPDLILYHEPPQSRLGAQEAVKPLTDAPQPTGAGVPAEMEPSLALLTVEEAARRLSLGRTTVYALLKDGQITSVRIGRLRRIPAEALAAYTARLIAEQNVA